MSTLPGFLWTARVNSPGFLRRGQQVSTPPSFYVVGNTCQLSLDFYVVDNACQFSLSFYVVDNTCQLSLGFCGQHVSTPRVSTSWTTRVNSPGILRRGQHVSTLPGFYVVENTTCLLSRVSTSWTTRVNSPAFLHYVACRVF